MFLQNSEKKIEEEFLKLTEKLGADREPLKNICGKLDACDRAPGAGYEVFVCDSAV